MSMHSKYQSSNDNQNSGSGYDGERDDTLKLTPNATVRGTIERLFVGFHRGQSLGIKFAGGQLVDGVLYRRTDRDDMLKLFSWADLPVPDEFTADDAPERWAESFQQTGTINYELVAARVEGDDENGIEADPADPVDIGDFIVWEGGQSKPSVSARMFAQLLTPLGAGAVKNEEDINDWLNLGTDADGNYNIRLRDDLEGVEVDVYKKVVQGDNYPFHRPVIEHAATGNNVYVLESEDDTLAETTETTASTAGNGSGNGELPEAVEDFIRFAVQFELNDEAQIRDELDGMVERDDIGLTDEMIAEVGGPEVVVARVLDTLA